MTTAPSDTPEALAAEAEAAQAREEIVAESASFIWLDIPLQPWSYARESQLARLIAIDVPAGDLDELPQLQARLDELKAKDPTTADMTLADVADVATYVPTAAKLLFIACVPQHLWFHLRGKPAALIAEVEKWAEENIPPDQECEACVLAQKVRSAHLQIMAMRRPQRRGTRHEGN